MPEDLKHLIQRAKEAGGVKRNWDMILALTEELARMAGEMGEAPAPIAFTEYDFPPDEESLGASLPLVRSAVKRLTDRWSRQPPQPGEFLSMLIARIGATHRDDERRLALLVDELKNRLGGDPAPFEAARPLLLERLRTVSLEDRHFLGLYLVRLLGKLPPDPDTVAAMEERCLRLGEEAVRAHGTKGMDWVTHRNLVGEIVYLLGEMEDAGARAALERLAPRLHDWNERAHVFRKALDDARGKAGTPTKPGEWLAELERRKTSDAHINYLLRRIRGHLEERPEFASEVAAVVPKLLKIARGRDWDCDDADHPNDHTSCYCLEIIAELGRAAAGHEKPLRDLVKRGSHDCIRQAARDALKAIGAPERG